MNKKLLIIALGAIAGIGLAFLIYNSIKKENEFNRSYFKPVELSGNNRVFNRTDRKYLDTIVSVGLDFLMVKGTNVLIKDLPKDIKQRIDDSEEFDLRGAVAKVDGGYIVVLTKMSKREAMRVMSHELIHIQQYHSGQLSLIDSVTIKYNGSNYDITKVPYKDREWETDAFLQQSGLLTLIEAKLLEDE